MGVLGALVVALVAGLVGGGGAAGGQGPVLLSPGAGVRLSNPFVAFSWASATGTPTGPGEVLCPPSSMAACSYEIEVATSEGFGEGSILRRAVLPAVISRYLLDSPDVLSSPSTATATTATNFFWRVLQRAGAGGEPLVSAVRNFTVVAPAARERFVVPPGAAYAAIQTVVAKAVAASRGTGVAATVVDFPSPAQSYRLEPPQPHGVFLNLTGARDLTVDGHGAALTFTRYLSFAFVTDSRNVVLRNFTFDFAPLAYTAVTVTAAGPGHFDASLVPGHPLLESDPHFASYRMGEIMDPAFPRVARGEPLIQAWTNVTRLAAPSGVGGPGGGAPVYRFTSKSVAIKPGQVLAIDPRIDIGFNVVFSDNVIFYGLGILAMANEGLTANYAPGHAILHCQLRLLPGRFLTGNNGGTNQHSARVGLWVQGCLFENTGDDISNSNQLNSLVAGVINASSIQLRPGFADVQAKKRDGFVDARPGDVLQFFDAKAGVVLAESTVVAVAGPVEQLTNLTLHPPLPATVTAGTVVYNTHIAQNECVFLDNRIRNGRRVGLLVHGVRGWIAGNHFEGLGGGGVEAWNDPYEGLCISDYVVEDNVFLDTNQLARYAAPIWLQSFGASTQPCHRNLVVRRNQIRVGPGPAVLLGNAANVAVYDNVLQRCGTDPCPWLLADPASVANLTSRNNTVVNLTVPELCAKPGTVHFACNGTAL